MKDIDKQYMTYDQPEEESHDPWEFIGQQVKGLIALAIFIAGLWMIIAAVVLK
jgi:hypothetical protein